MAAMHLENSTMGQITDGLTALIERMKESDARLQAHLDDYAEKTGKHLDELKKLNEEE